MAGSHVGLNQKKSAPGAGLFVGAKLSQNFGLEFGFQKDMKAKTKWEGTRTIPLNVFTDNGSLSISNQNLYLDAVGYKPLSQSFELIGVAGVGYLKTKAEFENAWTTAPFAAAGTEAKNWSNSKLGLRLGGGVQYKLTERFNARAMIVAQQGNSIVKHHTSARLGLTYSL